MENSPLKEIPVTVHERKMMKSARCWRVTLALPENNEVLAPVLSGMIGTQVRAELRGTADVDIDPAAIVDVPQKGRRFFLEIENVYERQNGIGPALTVLAGQSCLLTLLPVGEETPAAPETVRGDVTEKTLRGLHMAFFPNALFWQFIQQRANAVRQWSEEWVSIASAEACKTEFKRLAGVSSCRDLSEAYVRNAIRDFNKFINQGGRSS